MKYKISLICAVCCLPPVLSGCGSRQNAATEPTIITVNYNGLQDKGTVNLSELFEEPEFIALDSRSTDAYVSDQTNAISDNYIGRSGGYFKSIPYKLYDRKTGEYLGPVGNIGRGPGEYAYILSSYIDEQNGRIWLHYAPEKLYVYDLKTREFIEDVPLAYGLGDYNFYKSDFIVHPESGTITCVRVPYPEDMDTVIAWQQDFKGNVLWAASEKGRSMPSTQSEGISTWLLTSHKNVSNGIDASFNTLNAVEDTVFIAVNGRMNPVFTIDLGRKGKGKHDDNKHPPAGQDTYKHQPPQSGREWHHNILTIRHSHNRQKERRSLQMRNRQRLSGYRRTLSITILRLSNPLIRSRVVP